VKTVNETSMAERLGERYGVQVYEVPVGFKYVGPKMIETGAMMGGEESGGFGFGMHLPERDGIFADLMLLDLFLREKDAGRWPVSKAIAHLHEIAGPSSYRRVDVHFDRAVYPALKDRLLVELPQKAPTELAGRPVVRTQTLSTNDGFKFFADDGSWLLVRFSGTEPLVLAEHRGLKAPVVKTVNETSMAERLGERYGVQVYEVPVGFKYVGPKMIETGAMMGGEESGGFGFGMHLPERDGIFADLMLLDLFLREKDAGRWPVSKAIAHLHEIAGPSSYRRVDVHFDRAVYPALKDRLLVELPQKAPTELAGRPVVRTQTLSTNDGFKFFADDGSWLLVRFSGTEPLVRVYTEAVSVAAVDANLVAGEAIVRGS